MASGAGDALHALFAELQPVVAVFANHIAPVGKLQVIFKAASASCCCVHYLSNCQAVQLRASRHKEQEAPTQVWHA
jgi:hypothetical protein